MVPAFGELPLNTKTTLALHASAHRHTPPVGRNGHPGGAERLAKDRVPIEGQSTCLRSHRRDGPLAAAEGQNYQGGEDKPHNEVRTRETSRMAV